MIRIEKLNKYFNKGKSNQIHVINNTTMTLPSKGIVTLLGPSGCGKTTLLNAIGGLDKVNSGKITIDADCITVRSANRIDDIRNARIGYIFQNFNLLDDRTVFENVAIALRMVGIKDKKIIEERVNYCLDAVGIYQYRYKNADALSGGQRQRVAIARAIVKNPSIIIADEPTGNLDSGNTLEVMNIIKTISKDRLVLLVTHERKIADFYSDHVAEIKDGKIVKAYNNDSSRYLDFQLENKIYLKDMPVQKNLQQDTVKVNYYSDSDRDTDIKLVIRGGNLYIDTGGAYNIIDDQANVELIDDHYSMIDASIYENHNFEYDAYMPENFKAKYTSIYTPWNLVKKGFETVRGFKKMKKALLAGFVFAAMFTFLAVSSIMGITDIEESDYLTTNEHYISVSNPKHSTKLMSKVADVDGAEYVMAGPSKYSISIPMDDYLQTTLAKSNIDASVTYIDTITKDDIVLGKMPENSREVVLDSMVVNKFIKNKYGVMAGVTEPEKFIGRRIKFTDAGEYTISGISDTNSPSLYVDRKEAVHIITNAESAQGEGGMTFDYEYDEEGKDIVSYKLKPSTVKITKGRAPKSDYEVVVDASHEYEYALNKTIDKKYNGHKLTLVGFYKGGTMEDKYYVTDHTTYLAYIGKVKQFQVYAEDTDALLASLDEEGISAKINAERDKSNYMKQMMNTLKSSLIVAAILLAISLIEMYLMLRSSFLARIKEVGIMRAIGLKKKDIYRMFAGEIIVISVLTAVPGIALMYYILSNVVKITGYLESMYMVTPLVALISFAFVLLFNLLVGLMPVFRTMRKRPAEILARTDI